MELGGIGGVMEILARATKGMAHASTHSFAKNANEWGTLRVSWGTRRLDSPDETVPVQEETSRGLAEITGVS